MTLWFPLCLIGILFSWLSRLLTSKVSWVVFESWAGVSGVSDDQELLGLADQHALQCLQQGPPGCFGKMLGPVINLASNCFQCPFWWKNLQFFGLSTHFCWILGCEIPSGYLWLEESTRDLGPWSLWPGRYQGGAVIWVFPYMVGFPPFHTPFNDHS